jgi:hypothetical protein
MHLLEDVEAGALGGPQGRRPVHRRAPAREQRASAARSSLARETRSPWAPIARASSSKRISSKSVPSVVPAGSVRSLRIVSASSAMLWLNFTMPHCRSQSTRKTTGRPWRTAVSISCGWKPIAPSPRMQ